MCLIQLLMESACVLDAAPYGAFTRLVNGAVSLRHSSNSFCADWEQFVPSMAVAPNAHRAYS